MPERHTPEDKPKPPRQRRPSSPPPEPLYQQIAHWVALIVEIVAVLIVVYGIVHFSPPNASTISAGIAVGALARAIDSSRSGGL